MPRAVITDASSGEALTLDVTPDEATAIATALGAARPFTVHITRDVPRSLAWLDADRPGPLWFALATPGGPQLTTHVQVTKLLTVGIPGREERCTATLAQRGARARVTVRQSQRREPMLDGYDDAG